MSSRGRRTSVITYEGNFNYDTMKLRTIAQSDDLLITHKNGNGIFLFLFDGTVHQAVAPA